LHTLEFSVQIQAQQSSWVTERQIMQKLNKKNGKNFVKKEKVQVFKNGAWVDYSVLRGSKIVTKIACDAELIYGVGNVKIVSAQYASSAS
jgi:hypothetical protein